MNDRALTLDEVCFGYPGCGAFLGPIGLTVQPGECWAIVGPNGAGKSTLLRLLAGLLSPRSGMVRLEGRSLQAHAARYRAQRLSFLPQQVSAGTDLTAREVVLLGRYPHRTTALFESPADHAQAEAALAATRTLSLADRSMSTLSGGEAQRVHLAAALAQEPHFLLLDEPTASLDLRHQLEVFDILRQRVADGELGVVVVSHDVNLAAAFCTHVLVLNEGKAVVAGAPHEVLSAESLAAVYGVALTAMTVEGTARRWLVPTLTGRDARA